MIGLLFGLLFELFPQKDLTFGCCTCNGQGLGIVIVISSLWLHVLPFVFIRQLDVPSRVSESTWTGTSLWSLRASLKALMDLNFPSLVLSNTLKEVLYHSILSLSRHTLADFSE